MSFTLHTAAGDFRAIKALVTAQYAGVAVAVNTISNEKAATLSKDKAFLADRTKCDVQVRTFKMGHESCEQELAVCANWLAKVLAVDNDDAALGAAAGVNFIK